MSVKFTLMSQFIPAAEEWLSTNTTLPQAQRHALATAAQGLVAACSDSVPNVISVCGAPGTGKSTLAHACCSALEDDRQSAMVLSLDDYYLTAKQRNQLARAEHPLFAVRGVPGTHDLDLLTGHVRQLFDPAHGEINLPRFDKSTDDRMEAVRVVPSGFVPSFLFIEGWIAGVPPQAGGALLSPVNQFEASNDEDGEWRAKVNAYLYDYHEALDPIVNTRCYLDAPDWESVVQWRLDQETDTGSKMLTDLDSVRKFLEHYERLCDHMHKTHAAWADIIIRLDGQHFPVIAET